MNVIALGLAVASLALAAAAPVFAADNELTPAEKAAGWKLLFDGKTTAGWKGFKTAAPDAGWKVADGAIGPTKKISKDIITKENFENFDLTFDWKISPKGNSGVMFHVIPVGDETYESGPEYQILDNAHGEPPLQQAGSLFALYAPSMDMTKPVGQWNHGRIVVDHGKVQHWMNGMKIVEYDINSADFKARVAGSKFKQWPQFATGKTGAIALQMHGDPVWFQNIKIKVLK
ncbi:MAG: 3-keto-disaccharide hydrolase [Phenylobacterium sp.]